MTNVSKVGNSVTNMAEWEGREGENYWGGRGRPFQGTNSVRLCSLFLLGS
jgi:hypothetical protein